MRKTIFTVAAGMTLLCLAACSAEAPSGGITVPNTHVTTDESGASAAMSNAVVAPTEAVASAQESTPIEAPDAASNSEPIPADQLEGELPSDANITAPLLTIDPRTATRAEVQTLADVVAKANYVYALTRTLGPKPDVDPPLEQVRDAEQVFDRVPHTPAFEDIQLAVSDMDWGLAVLLTVEANPLNDVDKLEARRVMEDYLAATGSEMNLDAIESEAAAWL